MWPIRPFEANEAVETNLADLVDKAEDANKEIVAVEAIVAN